jgi:hypothetical protein
MYLPNRPVTGANRNVEQGSDMMTIEQLAARILGEHATGTTVEELTACLHHGNGLMSLGSGTGRGLAVLGNITTIMEPGAENFYPRVMFVKTPPTPKRSAIIETRQVGKHWRDIGEKVGLGKQRPEGNAYKNWAPAATHSLARVTIGGPVGRIMATTPDRDDPNNKYEWYDLKPVPVGGIVYRVARPGHVMLFQRVLAFNDGDRWVRVNGESGSLEDYNDAHCLVRESGIISFTSDLTKRRPLAFKPEIIRREMAPAADTAGQSGESPAATPANA